MTGYLPRLPPPTPPPLTFPPGATCTHTLTLVRSPAVPVGGPDRGPGLPVHVRGPPAPLGPGGVQEGRSARDTLVYQPNTGCAGGKPELAAALALALGFHFFILNSQWGGWGGGLGTWVRDLPIPNIFLGHSQSSSEQPKLGGSGFGGGEVEVPPPAAAAPLAPEGWRRGPHPALHQEPGPGESSEPTLSQGSRRVLVSSKRQTQRAGTRQPVTAEQSGRE